MPPVNPDQTLSTGTQGSAHSAEVHFPILNPAPQFRICLTLRAPFHRSSRRVSQGSFLLVSLFPILPSYRFGFDLFPKVYKFVPIQSFVLPGENFDETGPLFTTLVSPSSCLAGACSFQNPSAEASSACKQCCCVTHMQFPAMLCNGRWQERKEAERASEEQNGKPFCCRVGRRGGGGWTKRLAAC